MFTRFNGNVVPFADDATSTNRTVFGGVTQSDAIDDNLNADFKKGWEIVGLNDNPTREDFNAMGYTLGALISYLYEMGISEWNTSQNYRINSRAIGSDGKIYKSLTGTTGTPNVNHNPTTDTTNWEIDVQFDINTLTNKTTPIDADELVIADSTSSFSLKKLSFSSLKATLLTYFDTLYSRTSAVFGIGQTWQNVTGSRAYGVTYTNSTGKPIEVNIVVTVSAGIRAYLTIDGVSIVSSVAGYNNVVAVVLQAIIPSGSTYLVINTVLQWNELR